MTKDMTNGSPLKLIIAFCLPLVFGNFFQQFYNMVDTIIVGKFVGTKALAAVGSTGTIIFLIIGFLLGLTAGFTVLTAQKYGVDVSGFSFDKVCEMQAFGQKDPKDLRSFIQDVKSAAYSIGKQVDRNLGKSEQEFMPDEFAVPEEKPEKPAKNKKSPER